jgi:replicative DNA helicase
MASNMLTQKHNEGVEREVLGGIFKNPNLLQTVKLRDSDFYSEGFKEIFRAISTKGVSLEIAAEAYKMFCANPIAEIRDMFDEAVSPITFEPSVRYIQRDAMMRQFANIVQSAEDRVSDSEVPAQAIAAITQEIIAAMEIQPERHIGTEKDFFDDAMQMITQSKPMEIGLGPLLTVRNGQYIAIGARPGCGKSSIALQIALELGKNGRSIVYSMEMPRREVAHRILCQMAGKYIHPSDPRYAEYVNEAKSSIGGATYTVNDNSTLRIQDLWAFSSQIAAREKVSCVIVDYIGLVQVEKMDRVHEKMAHISTMLKRIAMDLDVPVFVCAQLKREGGETPTLESFAGSDQIGRDADQAWLLWTDKDLKDPEYKQSISISLEKEKNRGGDLGTVPLSFLRPQFKFTQGSNWQ